MQWVIMIVCFVHPAEGVRSSVCAVVRVHLIMFCGLNRPQVCLRVCQLLPPLYLL